MEMDVCGLFSTGGFLYAGLVGRISYSPDFVEPANLPQQIPTKEIFAATKTWSSGWATGESAG
jgi:hypothetical protein